MRFLVLLLCLVSTPAFAQCGYAHGGDIYECDKKVDTYGPACLPQYHSAGTLVMRSLSCVCRNTRFGFHSAYYATPDHGLSPEGNAMLREAYGRFPYLLAHLDGVGVFQSRQIHRMSGAEMARYGVPLCR